MRHQWILDTLGDLRHFALLNGLTDLAADLARARRTAVLTTARTEGAAKSPAPTGPGAAAPLGSAHECARPDIFT